VINIYIPELIRVIPELITIFLPGFIFINIYNWLVARKDMDFSIVVLWSFFISVIIRTVYQAGHSILPIELEIAEQVKTLVYIMTAGISPFFVWTLKEQCFSKLVSINNKSINDEIWNDVINYKESTMLKVYLKESDILYIGRFATREEKGLDSWIAITEYARFNKNNDLQYYSTEQNEKSMVVVNMRDIERVEFVYQDDSVVWTRYNLV
jgi:hypothetical protein